MKKAATITLTALAASLAAAGSAQTGSITQVVPFDYDPAVSAAFPEFQLFDTLGGTRALTGVTLSYDQQISFDVQIEQNSPVAIDAGNFFADVLYISLHQLGPTDDGGGNNGDGRGGDGSGPPFLGPGAHGDIFQPGLAATDGFNGSGPDTFVGGTDSGIFNFTSAYTPADGSGVTDAFTGAGTLSTVFAGFTEIFGGFNSDPGFPAVDPSNPPQGPFFPFQDPFYGAFVDVLNIRHQGTITATFEFAVIPAPASMSLLGVGGLVGIRRRR